VIHAAALLDGSSRSKIFQVNINGTIELLRLSEMINAKQFIFISGYNFFDLTKKGKITESEIASPSTDYGMSKFLAEKAIEVDKYFRGSKKIFRIPSPVSPDISSNKIFGRFVINAKLNKILEIYGDGKRLQNYLDLRELKNLIVLSFSSNLSGVWNLADEKLISDLDLAHTIVSTINSRSKVVAKFNANYNQDSMREIECCKIVNDFGFKHSFSISDTIKWVSNGLGNIND
jgi:UDP-glucose 4-epimerase